mmetsp:Transcript_41150/g.116426  ORF Transcript_41150/g.116426 Transcript_41150/m.116426 type:complete len:263 (+) Transcript_41150:110-898(+)
MFWHLRNSMVSSAKAFWADLMSSSILRNLSVQLTRWLSKASLWRTTSRAWSAKRSRSSCTTAWSLSCFCTTRMPLRSLMMFIKSMPCCCAETVRCIATSRLTVPMVLVMLSVSSCTCLCCTKTRSTRCCVAFISSCLRTSASWISRVRSSMSTRSFRCCFARPSRAWSRVSFSLAVFWMAIWRSPCSLSARLWSVCCSRRAARWAWMSAERLSRRASSCLRLPVQRLYSVARSSLRSSRWPCTPRTCCAAPPMRSPDDRSVL